VTVDKLEELCKHSSDMEQLAASAERASIKYKQVEYMRDHLGEVYDGLISGVTEWGLFVEINDSKCEGLVPMRDLADDYYDFDEKNYCLVGRRHNIRYRLGDAVKIQVARANLDKKQLDFVIVDDKNPARTLDQLGEQVTVPQALNRKSAKGKSGKAKAKAKAKTKTKAKQPKRSKRR
jgi:ribonuclease R